MTGVHLARTDENVQEIDALAARLGGRVGLVGVLGDLDRQARRSLLGRLLGRAVDEAYVWEPRDARDHRWWPQGLSSSADASPDERVLGRRLLVASWYAHDVAGEAHGSRLTFLDLDTLRYRHVLLVTPELEPVRVHAGGIAWLQDHVHVAATARGLVSFRLDDIVRHELFGHQYVLPLRFGYRAHTDEGAAPLRYSFVSVGRDPSPHLVVGEYGRGTSSRRLATFDLADEGVLRPTQVEDGGVVQMQGAVAARGRYYVTTSHGPWRPGSIHAGRPGRFAAYPWAVPMGPEDLTYWPSTDRLWSLSEHPHRRWVFSMPRSRFEGTS